MVSDHPDADQSAPVIDMHVHAYLNDPRFGTQFVNPPTGKTLPQVMSGVSRPSEVRCRNTVTDQPLGLHQRRG